MNNPEDLLKEYKGLKGEREQYVTQEPMSLNEVDRLSNMMNEYKGVEVTPEQQTALQETQLAADIASMEPNPEPIIDAEEEQKRIDMMSFKEAFDEHYEKYKDLPVEERPTYIYRGGPVKVETKEEKLGITKPDTDLSKTLIERPKEEPKKEDVVDSVFSELRQKEGKGDLTGAAPTGDLGVTSEARKQVGLQEKWNKAKTEQERDAIDREASKKYLKYLYNKFPRHWKKMPIELQKAFLDTSYNIGPNLFKYKNVNKGIKDNNWDFAAKNILDTANIDGQTSKGLAKRRAQAYNKIAEVSGLTPIREVEQKENGTILYKDIKGNTIFTYNKKSGKHSSSEAGSLKI